MALAVREARRADPSSFDEEKTWYRRHTNKHTAAEWGSPEAEWAAQQEVVAQKRFRDPPAEDVGLGDAFSGFFGDDDADSGEEGIEEGADY